MINEIFPGLQTYVLDAFVAAHRSKVTRKRMGSVIVARTHGNVWHLISDGCNGVDSGDPHVFEQEGVTLENVRHAEYNAISKLEPDQRDELHRFKDIVIIVMSSPCVGCAGEIIRELPTNTSVLYVEAYRDQRGIELLNKRGYKTYDLTADDVSVLIDTTQDILFELRVAKYIGIVMRSELDCFYTAYRDTYLVTPVEQQYPLNWVRFKREFDNCIYFTTNGTILSTDNLRSLRYALLSLGSLYGACVYNNTELDPHTRDVVFDLQVTNPLGKTITLSVVLYGNRVILEYV